MAAHIAGMARSEKLSPRARSIVVRWFDVSPEGSLVVIHWAHEFDAVMTSMVVWGHNEDEAWRRAKELEDDQCVADDSL